MKDYKTSLLIFLSVLLVISAGLLFSSIYFFYFKMPQLSAIAAPNKKDALVPVTNANDSLAKLYASTITELGKHLDAPLSNTDSLKATLDDKLNEFNLLRNEILAALKERSSNGDLGAAREKINELQQKVASLHYTNLDIERENKRLLALLTQLTNYDSKIIRPTVADKVPVNSAAAVKSNPSGDIFLLNDLHFSAIQLENEREQETSLADQTQKLLGSFKVRNRNIQSNNAEIVIVVLQPDGKVVQNSTWDTGTFETSEGRKVYSGKLRIDYNKGELKQLMFSVTADKYQHGNYTLKVYHKGILIGEVVKNLS
jgi:hypothetical protein